MKTKMRIALWACFALIVNQCVAGNNNIAEQIQDTILIVPDSNIKVLVLHEDAKQLTSYQQIDTLIDIMINDVMKARMNPDYPQAPKTTHYFVCNDARRRLKTENDDYLEQGIDIEKEGRAMNLGLYPYAYFIHDNNGIEIQIYLSDPTLLEKLKNYNLAKAIRTVADDKDVMKKNFRADMERKDSEWILKKTEKNRNDMLELSPVFGFGLIGNQWSPSVGFDLMIELSNKYGFIKYKFGLSYLAYTFTSTSTLDFENINFTQSFNVKWMYNLNSKITKGKQKEFFGLSAGLMKTTNESSLDKRPKFGIVTEGIGPFTFSFDIIFLKEKKSIYGMTMLIPF